MTGAWMDAFARRMRDIFATRVLFVGWQGSRARGEAEPDSDLDVVVVLDRLEPEDVLTYRAALKSVKAPVPLCGFLCGRAELAAWDRGDLFGLVCDTLPVYGDLRKILPPLTREDARRAALAGACAIYHACVHNLLYERDTAALAALYKQAGFALRALWFYRTGECLRRTDELAARLSEDEARLLGGRRAARCAGASLEALSEPLFRWAQEAICTLGGGDNQKDT